MQPHSPTDYRVYRIYLSFRQASNLEFGIWYGGPLRTMQNVALPKHRIHHKGTTYDPLTETR